MANPKETQVADPETRDKTAVTSRFRAVSVRAASCWSHTVSLAAEAQSHKLFASLRFASLQSLSLFYFLPFTLFSFTLSLSLYILLSSLLTVSFTLFSFTLFTVSSLSASLSFYSGQLSAVAVVPGRHVAAKVGPPTILWSEALDLSVETKNGTSQLYQGIIRWDLVPPKASAACLVHPF